MDRQDLVLKFGCLEVIHLANFIKYVIIIVHLLCANYMTLMS